MNRFLLVLLACVGCLASRSVASAAERPDIVVFLSDDHTWRDSSVYGSDEIETPNMARVAAAGMTFDQAFVASPACAPSRAALLTGLYPANNGAEPNHSRPRADIKKLPAYLQQLGYEVVSFGKVGHYKQTTEYGFDLAQNFNYHEDTAVPNALKWLRERDDSRPLCLFVGTNWPHVPWPEQTGEFNANNVQVPSHHVDTPQTRAARAKYLAAVRIMDTELGQVFDLAREELGNDTFFLHTSDHGAQWPFGKWNLYEEGIRTPLIVSWPGQVQPNTRSDAMVSWIDILPTLVDVAGGEPPSAIDGRSFLPVLSGQQNKHRDVILTTHSGDGDKNIFPIRSARTSDRWKYIRNLHPEFRFTSHVTEIAGRAGYWESWVEQALHSSQAKSKVQRYLQRPAEELYYLADDPYEQNNMISDPSQSERVAALRAAVDQWTAQTHDTLAYYNAPKPIVSDKTPNIVNVFIDDMGWSDVSCFGGDVVQTPNIDRLASEGIKFTQYYVNSPICSPSRVALTTGQYPQRHRISSYLANRQSNRKRGIANWLSPKSPVLARELNAAGYATGHFGKWHMGGQRDVGDAPLIDRYGFDRSLTNFEGLGPRVLPLKDAYDGSEPQPHDLGSANLGQGPIRWEDRSVVTAAFVGDAVSFIDQSQVLKKPFYINLWPDDVHSPFFPPEVLRDATGESKRELYYAVLKAMDEQLGVLFDRIRNDPDLKENTLIVFSSDNGPEPGAGSAKPLRGSKTYLYEGGIRSPLIVWGPGVLADDAAGTVNSTSVFSAIDLNRSLYSITGTPLPEKAVLDGEDLHETLLGNANESRKAPIFWRRPPDRPGTKQEPNSDLAMREGKWKFHVNYDGSGAELYDLNTDVSESNNVADANKDLVARFKKMLLAWNSELPKDAGDPAFKQTDSTSALPSTQFVNPIAEGADPWLVRDPNAERYLWCFSDGNRGIAIHTTDKITSLGEKHIVWRAPETGPYSREIWAPELHYLDDRWHIYFAGSDGKNENHLAYVLRSESKDPLGPYKLQGPFATGDGDDGRSPNLWAIDMTVLEHQGRRYAIWSGWDAPGTDQQYLYIAPMKSPTQLAGPRVRICDNDDYLWERVEPKPSERGLAEGPQVLKHGKRTFVIYSCGASWLPTYKLGQLELVGDDPLDPASWQKKDRPVFQATAETYGVGHSCFVQTIDGKQWWHVFHAKRDREPGWRRSVFVQPMRFRPNHSPMFGKPVAAGVPLDLPSGESSPKLKLPYEASLKNPAELSDGSYYGHHQFISHDDAGVHLGVIPETPINAYRSGEKWMLGGELPADFEAAVTIDFRGDADARDAGLLFRTTAAAVGFDAQRGYFAGLIPRDNRVIFGRTNGENWREIARADLQIDPNVAHRFRVRAKGDRFEVFDNGKLVLTSRDAHYATGGIGLRVVNTHAVFSDLSIEPL